MPTAPPTRCTTCGAKATARGRCPQHQRPAWETPSPHTRTLTRHQRRTNHDRQLAAEPACRWCGSTTNLQADHIIPIADGGHPTDPANLQTLCEPCHDIKTKQENRERRARRRG